MKYQLFIAVLFFTLSLSTVASEGVFNDRIVIGGVMDLEGQSRNLGQNMKDGIEAAFKGIRIQGKNLEFRVLNDSYTPTLTSKQTEQLIKDDVFAMVGNVGTPTAAVSLPLLAQANIPAVGFFTGAGLLRPGIGDIINFRASYVQEAAKVIEGAVNAGLKPQNICAYVQNDSYGMAGVEGIKEALEDRPGSREIITRIDEILGLAGDNPERNNIGPVGVYQRNTLTSREGYESLKSWEAKSNSQCKLVVTVGTYAAIGRFAGYARYKGEDWVISAVSFTGAESLASVLSEFDVNDRVIMTQVVPELDGQLAIIHEAKKALGEDFNYVSFEGYLVGRMFVAILQSIPGEINRKNFLLAAHSAHIDLDGLPLDFSTGNQGSNLVTATYYSNKEYRAMTPADWLALF